MHFTSFCILQLALIKKWTLPTPSLFPDPLPLKIWIPLRLRFLKTSLLLVDKGPIITASIVYNSPITVSQAIDSFTGDYVRRSILTVGLLLVLVGIFIVNRGPQLLTPLAEAFGLVSYVQTVTAITEPTLLSVAPSNYTYLPVDLTARVQTRGMLMVGDGKEVGFYVMNEGNFSEWRNGHPSRVVLAKPFVVSYNFTFTPIAGGTYFFVFDNQDTSRRVVIFSLSIVQIRTVLQPVAEYAGYELLVIGILFAVLGLKTGRNKPVEPLEARTIGWICKFCGAENNSDQLFCSKCGRSQH